MVALELIIVYALSRNVHKKELQSLGVIIRGGSKCGLPEDIDQFIIKISVIKLSGIIIMMLNSSSRMEE